MGLREAIHDYFERHPRAKKALGIATAIATNFAIIASGSAALAVAASTIVKHQEDKDKQHRNEELVDFFKDAVQDPAVREALKNAVQEGGVEVANHVSIALNQLGTARPEAGQFVSSLKSEITVIIQQMGIIKEMLSYYEIPDTQDRVLNVWRLPSYLDDVLVIDKELQSAINAAIRLIREDKNVVILGAPGSGKTTAMYVIWKQLGIDTDTALVWDTKDISRVHEKGGIVLFTDDIPETRELARAIVEKDARGIVTTAREQEWSRLPIELRKKFSSLALPEISDSAMKEIAVKHFESQDVEFEDDALQVLVESAQGSPIYVRYMAEEIGVE
jgi:ABC-type glutathione transport system ATPase component